MNDGERNKINDESVSMKGELHAVRERDRIFFSLY